jgi:hypothetical protein
MTETLVGTWRLISFSSSTGQTLFGLNPVGLLTYTTDGRMSVIVASDGRKPLSNPDELSAPAEERAQAFSTFMAYSGRYSFTGRQVVHHVEIASIQSWANTDQKREVNFGHNRIVLRSTPMLSDGVVQTFDLVWERVV